MSEEFGAIEYLRWSGRHKLAAEVVGYKEIAANLGSSNQKLSAACADLASQLAALKEENERLLRELSDAGSRIVDLEAGEEILKARMAEQSEYILRLRKSIIDATNNGVPLDSGKWVYSIDDSVLEWPSASKEPSNEG